MTLKTSRGSYGALQNRPYVRQRSELILVLVRTVSDQGSASFN